METYLFICGSGEYRSPAAARIALDLLREHEVDGIATDFVGLIDYETARQKINSASRIFVMERQIAELIGEIRNFSGRIDCLDIPKGLSYHQKALEDKLREVLPRVLFN
jgi:predicted protein tyrosine phosphatase